MHMPRPLEGIKVLDISRAQMGPYAGVLLSDMGADVIKVEPKTGDFIRGVFLSWYPPGKPDCYCLAQNRGKRSLAIDYHSSKGREAVLKLAQKSDVFLQNFRPGVTDALGLGYKDVCELNQKIIYANVSGYGSKSPLKSAPAFDLIGVAMGGLMSMTGDPDGPPTPIGAAIGDQVGAMMVTLGIMTALFVRERTGVGQEVDVAMLDVQLAMQTWEITHYLVTGNIPRKAGRGLGLIPGLWFIFPCKDSRWIAVAGAQDPRWPGFCKALGAEYLIDDPRFKTAVKREENRDDLVRILDEIFQQQPAEHWLDRLHEEDQVVGPVNTYADIMNHPHVKANDMLITLDHHLGIKVNTVGNPIKLSKTPVELRAADPVLGQHTEEVLLELGYTWDNITAMRDEEVI
jgi:crotonobetainyl-CoA:carnitine CoA-transferase CaiB-like acyl-CoA transferase